jgi:hypothetical protein
MSHITRLIIGAAVQENIQFLQDSCPICDPKQPLHTKNLVWKTVTSEFFDRLGRTFFTAGDGKPWLERISGSPPTVDAFDSFLQIDRQFQIDGSSSAAISEDLGVVIPRFRALIESFLDDCKTSDWGKLTRVIQNAMFLIPAKRDQSELDFVSLYRFAEKLLRGDVLPRRLVGAQILSFAVKPPALAYNARHAFDSWKASSDIASVFTDGYVHPQLLEKLTGLLDEFMTPKLLEVLWCRAESEHSSMRPQLLSIVAKGFEKLGPQSAPVADFLRGLAARKTLTPDLIDILSTSLKSLETRAPALACEIADRLIENGSEPVKAGLAQFATYADTPLQRHIVGKCVEHLGSPASQDFAASLLAKFVRQAPRFGRQFVDPARAARAFSRCCARACRSRT